MIIRQTPLQQLDATTRRISELKSRFERQTQVATTQLEVLSTEDAGGAWQQIDRLQNALSDQDVFIANAKSAAGMLDAMDKTLGEAAAVVSMAQELSVRLANDTFSDDDRATTANQVDALFDTMVDLANSTLAGRALFAGTAYDGLAFADDGTYLGNTDVSSTRVAENTAVPTSVVGEELFRSAIQGLQDLAAALRSGPGSSDAVAAQLPGLDVAHELLVRGRQGVGFDQIDALDSASIADGLRLTLQEALNSRVAADPIESLTALAEIQSSYEIALQVTASTGSTTLFDFLR